MNIKTVLKLIQKNTPGSDFELVSKAYSYAEKMHKTQKRVSGEEYIQHPLHVAYILASRNLDSTTIAAALLHDSVEDTAITLDDLKKEFGAEIAAIVDGVTKITELKKKSTEAYHAESLRKIILATTNDMRVIFIKLADKLHNMRTLGHLRKDKRKRIAREVMDIYAPIAYKLGMANLKWELEDIAFKYLEEEVYKELETKIQKSRAQREKEIAKIKALLEKILKQNKVNVQVTGRPKHIYSVHKKMLKKNCSFEEIFDLAALRVITKKVKECYTVLGIIHNSWKPIPKEFDDYIAMPKSNMYQSLHTVVIGPTGQPIEVQIRTEEMHKTAEEGIAAHWQYKGVYGDRKFDTKLSWLRQILDWQRDSKDSKEFLEMLHIDFFEDEIFAFTPKGQVIELPKGACVIDFAYAIHTNLGEQSTGAKINGKFVPLRTLVKNGDVIDVVTSKNRKPSRDWLKLVVTSKAKSKIKQFIRATQDIPVRTVRKIKEEKKELEEWIINVENMKDPELKISQCCKPLPGDPIVAYSTKTNKAIIHKTSCFNVTRLKDGIRRKKTKAHWIDHISSVIDLKVEAVNRVGLFAEILNTLVNVQTKINHAGAKSIQNENVECSFKIESKGINHIQDLIRRIKKLKDVKKVYIGNLSK